ncbi:MAG: bifunctional DNA-binding transcriptional regulator/O6-methylguanine-DNA methyltransferase Ada [Planctomycetaceae bacterium]|nr:bifunctional DNA-binding transcriptional regulator/O6-methylguanine-DNA methyltransferase Ada [Planctomycetaceae bacterium]
MTTTVTPKHAFPTDDERWKAFAARDKSAEGAFVIAVRTTGIYCRAGCPARTPRRENVRFFTTCADAERAGFRECKRCQPNSASPEAQQALLVAASCRTIECSETMPSLTALARSAGLSASRFHRVFKQVTGVTPRAYAAAVRSGRLQQNLRTSDTVTAAIHASGYGSSGRFYDSSPQRLGMTPTQVRSGGRGTTIHYAVENCWLGLVLVAATERGICAIMFGDRAAPLIRDLHRRFPEADVAAGGNAFQQTVATVVAYVAQPACGLDLPLDVIGTAFQQQVWALLQKIPPGATTTYTEIARQLGRPDAVRAVATACAANPISVAIPCHRVVRKDGSLAGYYWGIERKQKLLERETTATVKTHNGGLGVSSITLEKAED